MRKILALSGFLSLFLFGACQLGMNPSNQNTEVVHTDTIQPEITCFEPQADAVDVAVGANLKLCFSEKMNLDDMSYGNSITLFDKEGVKVVAKGMYNPADNTYVIDPEMNLAAKSVYTLRVKTTVSDMGGNGLNAPVKLEFTTK